jgi:hypothetical protein
LRIKLFEFLLRRSDRLAFAVEKNRARACRSLIERENVILTHPSSPEGYGYNG